VERISPATGSEFSVLAPGARQAEMKLLANTVLALALAGCSVSMPQRPASTLAPPAAWRTAVGPAAAPEALWWSRFGDPVLSDLVQRALAHNGDVRIAAARLQQYQNGYASYLEELDAQRNAFSADQAVLQLRASLLAAHVDLYRAMGGAWQPTLQ